MPFKSLQGCLPDIADVLHVNRTTLYERQRALVREGLLVALPGHGRGSGVRATPESIAMLAIGMLSSVALADVGPLARSFSKASSISGVCPLTGTKTFHASLSRILSDESLSKRVTGISVRVNAGHASIGFDGASVEQDTDFAILAARLKNAKVSRGGKPLSISAFSTRDHQDAGLLISLLIPGETVRALGAVVRAISDDSGDKS